MKNAVIILISDQTVPNILFLKWFASGHKGEDNTIYFVSTEKMEENNKSQCIVSTLNQIAKQMKVESPVILDDENSLPMIQRNVQEKISSEYDRFYLNITGGNKLMSLAVYMLFNANPKSIIYYQPIGKSLQQISPEFEEYELGKIMSVNEYMNAYGINISPAGKCVKEEDFYKNILEIVNKNKAGRSQIHDLIDDKKFFKRHLEDGKRYDLTNLPVDKLSAMDKKVVPETMQKTVADFGFDFHNVGIDELKYISGGWFEEFVYYKVMREKNLSPKKIALNVYLTNSKKVRNELDVVYIENNALRVIECKSFINEKGQKVLLTDTIYKIQALKSQFGLSVKSYLYTLSPITEPQFTERAKTFDIEIVDGHRLGLQVCIVVFYFS